MSSLLTSSATSARSVLELNALLPARSPRADLSFCASSLRLAAPPCARGDSARGDST
eukprot:CAMPEP_0198728178 /NCGR_PEP_ID=MMETSP1475-20131203/7661_1 /TAXON_ID= ORGANISM="Unidentified sp., Strain CCMP1999" /NCGR_SAMPLE_ID=MMETSP1475 /ASSEMBLY_ACC=CAM_ASM_001111 /LENGTH=56 /DNA_ID=CAMNT_0044490469 /DNA_START=107 /DNA_END=277 /DNA_ORIENTATION=+